MDERTLIDTLRKIEALHAGATTEGERKAAETARDRILQRLQEAAQKEKAVSYKFTIHDPWERKMFLALARRYGLKPYRDWGQHRQTIMVACPKSFMDRTLWPTHLELAGALSAHLAEVTQRVISEAIHGDSSEAVERPALAQKG